MGKRKLRWYRRSNSRTRSERGEALVEFVILAPVLMLLLFGMVDFGRVYDAWVVSTNAAREGARYAAIYSTKDYLSNAQVVQMSQQKAFDYLTGGMGGRTDVSYTLSDITVSMPSTRWQQPVTVNVSVRVEIWALLNVFLSNQATVNASATMQV
ncbi:MAG: TadE/TadG family type IV pilus assembly protein [Dehalococcoidia bacterium]|nr:TadE/TadG family type IV pilus assembly protein [Dehalococcoidia bacterium]